MTTVRIVVAIVLAVVLSTVSVAGDAQTGEIESIREQRRQNDAEAKQKAEQINVADADLEEVTAVLVAINSAVNSQEGRVENARRQLSDAERTLEEASAAVVEGEVAITALRELLAARAISSFVNSGDTSTLLVENDDPNLALRMQVLVDGVTQADVDIADQLKGAEEDLEIERARAEDAAADAEVLRADMEAELGLLAEDEAVQAEVTAEAEERLDHLLSERDALKALGFELDQDLQNAQDAYAAELARKKAAAPPAGSGGSGGSGGGGGGGGGPVASSGEMVNVSGIWVHQSIADNVRRLLADASAAGVSLAGGGYRDPAGQIRVRKNNCGTSDYAVYQMPASQCRPPTARPGTSMHERGLAIDFTYNGRIIGRRSGAGWNWLKANAANYGLRNLPSEPWHWSTSGG